MIDIHKVYSNIFSLGKWREKRFQLFLIVTKPSKKYNLLDVGGYPGNWGKNSHYFNTITCLNLTKENNSAIPNLTTVQGDGRQLDFDDQQFDIVFSNSVIEHVGSFEDQKKFSEEILRVGRKVWVQTPAKGFFFEPHFLFPFFHWLPISLRKLVVYITPWYLINRPNKKTIDDLIHEVRILSKKELKLLFPNCSIIVERFLFFPKSYIVNR